MDVKDIDAINRASLKALEEARRAGSPLPDVPYYGYVTVDTYECPAFVLFTNNDSPVVKYLYTDRSFEPTSAKVWARLMRTATCALDIGANVGVYSFIAASLRKDISIHAFEANPFAYSRLRLNKMVNGFENVIESRFAVGDANRMVPFSWLIKPGGNIASGGAVGSSNRNDTETVFVEMHVLDGTGLAGQVGARPVIKIDVEGGEAGVFAGMKEILAARPNIILETFSAENCHKINELISALGYNVYLIREDSGALEPRDKLYPAVVSLDHNFNQLITTKSQSEIAALMA